MTDTIRVIPVLGEDGEPIMENGQIVVQNQADHALLSVSAEYLSDDSKTTFGVENKNGINKDTNEVKHQINSENERTVDRSEALSEKAVKFQWSHDTTKTFLRLFNSYKELKRTGKILKWKSIWVKIAKEMNSLGYHVDPTQVENKYKSLKRSYKYMVHHNQRIGAETKHIDFEQEVISLFSKKANAERENPTSSQDDSMSLSVSGEFSDRDNTVQDDDCELQAESCDEGSDKPTKFSWSKRATKTLLQLYNTNRDLMRSGKISKWKALWLKLSEEMYSHGYHVDSTQVENKYKSLKRAYKDMVQHNMKIGAQPKHIDFENEIVALFEKKNGSSGLPSVKTVSFQSSKQKQILPLQSLPGTLIAIPSKTPVRILQPNIINNGNENIQFVGVQDFANVHNIVINEANSKVEQGSSENKSDQRIRLTATGRILQDTLEVFRETSCRRDVFQSEIGELYRKEVLHAQQFREESLKIKNRKLDLLEKFLELKSEKIS